MAIRWSSVGCALALVLTLVGVSPAQDEQTLASMRARLEALEGEVEQLRARVREQDTWLDERRAEEIQTLVREVLADAETRSLLTDQPVAAGWDNGFFIASGDGNFLLRPRGLLMIRHVYNVRDDAPPPDTDDNRSGFELARTRFGFFGHVVDPTWQYAIWTGHSASGGVTLLDVYVRKSFGEGLSVVAGQFKLPFWREWLVSETRLPLVERSLLNGLSGGYSQGVMGAYATDRLHLFLAFTDGLGAANTPYSTRDVEYAVTARGEVLLMGNWKQYAEVEGWRDESPMLVLGAAAHYQQGEYGTDDEETEILRWTADASYKADRLSLLAAVLGNHQCDGEELDQYAVLLQAGVFVLDHVEAHLRWEWANGDHEGEDDLSILTFGLDYHIRKHQVRLITDVGYAFNGVSDFWASGNTLAGYRADTAGQDGQVVVRSQVQLSF